MRHSNHDSDRLLTLMLKLCSFSKGSWLLAIAGLGAIVGCTRSTVQPPAPAPSPVVDAIRSPIATPSPAMPQAAEVEIYNQALSKAASAQNLAKSALSPDDWHLVASRWQQAIESLKTLPPASPYGALAKDKLPQYKTGLATAQKRAAQAKQAEPRTPPGLLGSQPINVSSAVTTSRSGNVLQAKIKRRAGGTPIIDVTFNGTQTFEMIVDTGASGTVITQQMADALGIRIIGKTKVNTASQAGVEVPLGFVESISVGHAVIKEVIVAIGNEALDIGLLGHDFFSDYDVTVKRDVVEFRKR